MTEHLDVRVPTREGDAVSGILRRPATARAILVLAHGAGAGMRHAFMEAVAGELAERDVATLRYQFPYMEAGGRRADRAPVAHATVRAAVAAARRECPDLPVFAGGKSFGGRMTSGAAADGSPAGPAEGAGAAGGRAAPGGLDGVAGLVFFGFPLHPPKKPATERADHLPDVPHPMLFLQGTRDDLADLDLLRPIVERLGERATLRVVEGADHGFHVLKRSGRTDAEVLSELGEVAAGWMLGGR